MLTVVRNLQPIRIFESKTTIYYLVETPKLLHSCMSPSLIHKFKTKMEVSDKVIILWLIALKSFIALCICTKCNADTEAVAR